MFQLSVNRKGSCLTGSIEHLSTSEQELWCLLFSCLPCWQSFSLPLGAAAEHWPTSLLLALAVHGEQCVVYFFSGTGQSDPPRESVPWVTLLPQGHLDPGDCFSINPVSGNSSSPVFAIAHSIPPSSCLAPEMLYP